MSYQTIDPIVPMCLAGRPTQNEAYWPRKCYKCQIVLDKTHFNRSPSPDLTNGGKTWACRSCLSDMSVFDMVTDNDS